jgi:hypothetical protein
LLHDYRVGIKKYNASDRHHLVKQRRHNIHAQATAKEEDKGS